MRRGEFEVLDDDGKPILVRFDYSQAEPQSFDHMRGVGHPGCDQMVEITEINFGSGWVSAEALTEKERDAFETQVLDILEQIEDERDAGRHEEDA